MTTEERIARITFVAKEDARMKSEIKRSRESHICELLDKVESFAPRMKELMKVARSLRANRIPLGKYHNGPRACAPQFVSDGIAHRLGFIVDSNPFWNRDLLDPVGLGIIGGGACGNDIQFNEDGKLCEVFRCSGMPGNVGSWWDSDIRHLEEFVAGFDEFERKFYEYVDNL